MIEEKTYRSMMHQYGCVGSWAIWEDVDVKPKSNVGNMRIFERDDLLKILNTQHVFVGLNISRNLIDKVWGNFHDFRSASTDYKIRYALRDTTLWGSYMTDIFKDLQEKDSKKVPHFLEKNKTYEEQNVNFFLEEIFHLGIQKPILVAFGKMVHEILNKHFDKKFEIKLIPHYASYMSKEKYRCEVDRILINPNT